MQHKSFNSRRRKSMDIRYKTAVTTGSPDQTSNVNNGSKLISYKETSNSQEITAVLDIYFWQPKVGGGRNEGNALNASYWNRRIYTSIQIC